MKKILIIILTIVSLVALASCNIPIPEPKIPEEVNDVLIQEPTINQIDQVLNKVYTAILRPVSLNDYPVSKFKIVKNNDEIYKLAVLDNGNNIFISFPITVTDNKYYCGGFELIISDDFKKITIDGKEYGTTE